MSRGPRQVRNNGAYAVIGDVSDHAGEYMTDGSVVRAC